MEKIVEESNIIYMIVIKHKQSSISNILKEFPNAEIFGDDVVKVRSSLLLMDSVWNDPVIKEVIRKHGWK